MHTRPAGIPAANEPTGVGREETLVGNQLEDDVMYGCIVIRCWFNKLRVNCNSEFCIYWTVVETLHLAPNTSDSGIFPPGSCFCVEGIVDH